MDNISILLHILFGGLTSGIAANYSPGKPLGIWGYLIGAISGLVGGLLFLDLIRPNDVVGSVIAAMFTALLFIFVLRWAEEKGLTFDGFSTDSTRSPNVPKLAELPHENKSSIVSIFNIFEEDFVKEEDSEKEEKLETPVLQPFNNQANKSSSDAPPKQFAPQNSDKALDHNANGSAVPTRGYDEDMFGQGVNSLQGPALFDTDDEVPTLEASSSPRVTDGTVNDKSHLDRALDQLTSELEPPKNNERLVDRLPFMRVMRKESANNGPGNSKVTSTYDASNIDKSAEESTAHERPLFDDALFEHQVLNSGNKDADMVGNEREEDIYGNRYRFGETTTLESDERRANVDSTTAATSKDSVAAANGTAKTSSLQTLSSAQIARGTTEEVEKGNAQRDTDTTLTDSDDFAELESFIPAQNYPDDLTKIRGIDKVYAQRLHEMGIYTWIQVANTEPPLLRDWVAAANTTNVDEWPQLARSLAIANDRLEASYDGPPPDDLTEISGITKIFEQRLYQMGIATYSQLAEADAKTIIRGLAAFNVVTAAVYDWQILAKQKLK